MVHCSGLGCTQLPSTVLFGTFFKAASVFSVTSAVSAAVLVEVALPVSVTLAVALGYLGRAPAGTT